jgi:hypothetical protein
MQKLFVAAEITLKFSKFDKVLLKKQTRTLAYFRLEFRYRGFVKRLGSEVRFRG